MLKKLLVTFAVLLFCQGVFAQTTELRGRVSDTNNAPVENAQVNLIAESGKIIPCSAQSAGEFVCQISVGENFALEIKAQGFSILRQNYAKTQDLSAIQNFRLEPAGVKEQVVITANRTETALAETPASIIVLSGEQISVSAAPTLDDTLRQAAGFSIFRRSSSRNANPTTQGVSLRGVGASGASRSLVLFDGVALNDPFGGWIQWNRVAPVAVARVEVLRGGASSLYGNDSLSGAVNIIPKQASEEGPAVSAEIFGGSQQTFSGSAFAGYAKNGWSADGAAASFQTRGYVPVDKTARGPVDVYSGARSNNFSLRFARGFGATGEIFFRPSVFGEVRTNGTGLQTNRTHSNQYILGGRHVAGHFNLNWRVFGGIQVYDQIFSAVNAARTSESLNRVQRVPAQTAGFSGQISVIVKDHTLLFGAEGGEVRGASDETVFANNAATSVVGAGGRERSLGAFAQDFIKIGKKLIVAGSVRYDAWENVRALSSTLAFANNSIATVIFPDRREHSLSPQVSVLYQATENFALQAAASRSFRAPTLNELYRNFRVGNVLTLANENLRAERAMNFETGGIFSRGKTYIRGGFFWTDVDQPVGNITLAVTPALITRQRQNAGRTRSRGVEFDAETSFKKIHFSFGYLLADSKVVEFPANPILIGLLIPQVPRHQTTFQTRYADRDWTLSLQGRASSVQFDDDLNQFRLEPYFQLDVFAARRLTKNLKIFTGIENVFNSRYSVGRTPVRTVSSPMNVRVGLRWN